MTNDTVTVRICTDQLDERLEQSDLCGKTLKVLTSALDEKNKFIELETGGTYNFLIKNGPNGKLESFKCEIMPPETLTMKTTKSIRGTATNSVYELVSLSKRDENAITREQSEENITEKLKDKDQDKEDEDEEDEASTHMTESSPFSLILNKRNKIIWTISSLIVLTILISILVVIVSSNKNTTNVSSVQDYIKQPLNDLSKEISLVKEHEWLRYNELRLYGKSKTIKKNSSEECNQECSKNTFKCVANSFLSKENICYHFEDQYFNYSIDSKWISHTKFDFRLTYLYLLNAKQIYERSSEEYKKINELQRLDENQTWFRYDYMRLHEDFDYFKSNSSVECMKKCSNDSRCFASSFYLSNESYCFLYADNFSYSFDYRFISYSQIDLRLFYLFHLNTENIQQFSEKTYKLDEKPTWLRYENFRLHSHYGAFVFNSAEQCNKECFRDLNCYANTFSQNPSLQYARNICYFYNNTNSFLYEVGWISYAKTDLRLEYLYLLNTNLYNKNML